MKNNSEFNTYFMPILHRINDVFKSNSNISEALGTLLCYIAILAYNHDKNEILVLCDINNIKFFNDFDFMSKLLEKCNIFIEICKPSSSRIRLKNKLIKFLKIVNYKYSKVEAGNH